jgi:hypothetical protein
VPRAPSPVRGLATVCLATLALSSIAAPALGAAAPSRLALTATHEANLSRSVAGADEADALRWRLDARHPLAGTTESGTRATLALDGALVAVPEYDDLDHLEAGLVGRLRRTLGPGFSAPWAGLDLAVHGRAHRRGADRDGVLADVTALLGARATDRLRGLAGVAVHLRRGDGRVRDRHALRAFLRAELDGPADTLLWIGLDAARGDVVADGSPSDRLVAASAARAEDPTFGRAAARADAPPGSGALRVAYRLEADTLGAGAGVVVPLGPDGSVELFAERRRIDADGGLDYDTARIGLSLVLRLR